MRIATWNINGLRARLEYLQLWLEDRQPDVVGLQELKIEDAQFPRAAFETLGYEVLLHGQKSWNGVAVLSRETMHPETVGLPGQEALGARLLQVRIGELQLTTVYCPNGKALDHVDYRSKLDWFDDLISFRRRQAPKTAFSLLCGDFNIAPEPLDSWHGAAGDGRLFHTPEERTRFNALLQTGLHDLFRTYRPDEQAFSWWDYRGGAFHRGQGLRIDLILGSDGIRDRLRDIWIDRDYRKKKDGLTASDHAPVILDLADA